MTKRCPKCERELPTSAFGVRTNRKPLHWCRTCHCQYQREYFQRRKEYYAELQKQRVERNRRAIREAKNVPCADCGQRFPHYVMDFDHRPGEKKCFNLSIAAGQTRLSWERMLAESPSATWSVRTGTGSEPTCGASKRGGKRSSQVGWMEKDAAVAQW